MPTPSVHALLAKARRSESEHIAHAVQPRRPTHELGVHPGHEWFTVLSGTARLQLGERVILVEAGQAAQFSTMSPHAISADGDPVEVIVIFDRDGRRAHLDAVDLTEPGDAERGHAEPGDA